VFPEKWYGGALAFAEAGLAEEFLAVREAVAGKVSGRPKQDGCA
jgi:hypothetical protein